MEIKSRYRIKVAFRVIVMLLCCPLCYTTCCVHVLLRYLLYSRVVTLAAVFTSCYVGCCVDVLLCYLLC